MSDDQAYPTAPATMQGFPPAADQRVRFGDRSFLRQPQQRWSYSYMEQLVGTKAAWRGDCAAAPLPAGSHVFGADGAGGPDIVTLDGRTLSFNEAISADASDALVVLHHGELVHEQYWGHCGPHARHTMMSCNKSMVGTIAECLIASGELDDGASVTDLLPELADSAWQSATVRHVMDMVVDMSFTEDYMDQASDVWTFLRSTGMIPGEPGDDRTICDVLPTIRPAGAHGRAFAYREPNIFVLGWLVRSAAGRDLATLASEKVWQHIGAEHDWLYMVDGAGTETTALATARDLARFGQLIADRGAVGGTQVLPAGVVDAVLGGGDPVVFAAGDRDLPDTWSYRSQWWYRHVGDRICPVARGAQGQVLVIDPQNDLVVVRYASPRMGQPDAFDNLWWPIVDAITNALAG